MIVRSLAALLIMFAVGCASEKALNRGSASSVRVSAVVFDKAVYNAASQAELIEKFRSHDVEPLMSAFVSEEHPLNALFPVPISSTPVLMPVILELP